MTLKNEDIKKLANFARLELTDTEAEQYSVELDNLVDYVAQLQEVDVEGVEPTSQISGLVNVLRDDVVTEAKFLSKDLEDMAPDFTNGYFKVPGVFVISEGEKE